MAPYRESEGRLGEVVREHVWVGSGPLYGIGAAFVLVPVIVLVALPMGDDWTPMSWIGAALFFLVGPGLGIAMIVSARKLRLNFTALHERGMFHRWAGVEREVAYDEVVSIESTVAQQVRNGVAGPVTHRHRVRTRDGGELPITHGFYQVDLLVLELRHRTFDARMAAARAELKEGKRVVRGAITLSRKSFACTGSGTLPIESLTSLAVEAGVVTVFASGHGVWATVRASEVPDLDVVESLALELGERRRRKADEA